MSAAIVFAGGGGDFDILEMRGRAGKKVYFAENTTQAIKILALKVGRVAPLIYDNGKRVFTTFKRIGDVKLCGQVRAFAKTDLFAVDEKVVEGADPFKYDMGTPCLKAIGECEGALINAARRINGDIGGIQGNGVGTVDVLGNTVALHLPARGDGNGFLVKRDRMGYAIGNVHVALVLGKIPIAAQRVKIGRFFTLTGKGGALIGKGDHIGVCGEIAFLR